MPWVKIGRHRFDMDSVRLVTEMVGDAGEEGVSVTLDSGLKFDILGPESQVFLAQFDQHVAARSIGRSPPGERAPGVVLPEPPSRRRPAQTPGVEEVGLVRVDAPGDLNEA